jgi:hypothetical protein
MGRECREVRFPHGVDAKLVLIVSSNPLLQSFPRIPHRNLHTIVSASNAHALGCQPVKGLHTLLLNGWMPLSPISVDQDGVGMLQHGLVLGPSHGVNLHLDSGYIGQRFLKQEAACIEFMVTRPMTRLAGQQDDLLVLSQEACAKE